MYNKLSSLLFVIIITACLVCLGLLFSGCQSTTAQTFHPGSIYVSDTMLYKDHSYIIIKENFNSCFQVLHSPDCKCRFNRRFIVVKHER